MNEKLSTYGWKQFNLYYSLNNILYLYMYILESNNPQRKEHWVPFADLQANRDLKASI